MNDFHSTCPAWRNQGGAPVNARTCKHLQSLLGADYEAARLLLTNPNGPAPKAPKAKKAKGKKGGDPGEAEGESEGIPGLLLATKWDVEGGVDPTGWWISEKLDGVRCVPQSQLVLSTIYNSPGSINETGRTTTAKAGSSAVTGTRLPLLIGSSRLSLRT